MGRKSLTKEIVNDRLENMNRNIRLIGEYIKSNVHSLFACLDCKYEWMAKPNDILQGKGCTNCWISGVSFSKEDINFKIQNKNIILLGKYYNINTETQFKCLMCDYEWDDIPGYVVDRQHGCPVCEDKLPTTFESFNKKLEESGRNIRLIGEYIKSDEKTQFKCLDCNWEWDTVPSSITQGTGCPKCANKSPLTFDEVNERLENDNRTVRLIDNYITASKKATFICLVCGNIWDAIVDNILRNRNCPSCAKYGFDTSKSGILYYIKINHHGDIYYKIGITNKTVGERFKKYEMKNIEILNVCFFESGLDAYNKEQKILREFKEYRYNGEPILNSGGNTEIFTVDIFEGDYSIWKN